MSDERFEHDLQHVLREVAGGEASMSLRHRLADLVAEAPPGRNLWFTPPLRLSVVVVAAVAVLALAILLLPNQPIGPSPSGGPSPSDGSGSPTQPDEPSPTLAPTTEPTSAPTPVPTPIATPDHSGWTGIEWADPFAPFPYQRPVYVGRKGTSITIHTILPWNGSYVGAGSISHGSQCEEAAFFRSTDGVAWHTTGTFSSGDDFAFFMCPDHLLAMPGGTLLAIGQERVWRSTDGASWSDITSPGWDAVWADSGLRQMVDVAGGSGGVVAIGVDLDTGLSVVAQSPDGVTWEAVDLPAHEQAIVRDLAAYREGFVIVGRDGQPDGEASVQHPAVVPGIGRAAAWTSSDGVTWTEASAEADRVPGGGMTQVLVGSSGLFAVGINRGSDYYPATDYEAGDVVTAWVSTDGTTWHAAGALGAGLPPMGLLASDGTNMIGLGLRQPWAGQDATAWASVDGLNWTPLTVSGPELDVGYLVLEPQLTHNPPDTALWVLPRGLLALGSGDGVPINEPYTSQWFRLGAAVMP